MTLPAWQEPQRDLPRGVASDLGVVAHSPSNCRLTLHEIQIQQKSVLRVANNT